MMLTETLAYVSCTSRDIERAERFMARLRAMGAGISYDWTLLKRQHMSNDSIGDVVLLPELRADVLQGAMRCNVFVALISDPQPRGLFLELGAAFASSASIHIVGDNPDHWMRAFGHRFHRTDEEALLWFEASR
jgi:hypothetical protein